MLKCAALAPLILLASCSSTGMEQAGILQVFVGPAGPVSPILVVVAILVFGAFLATLAWMIQRRR